MTAKPSHNWRTYKCIPWPVCRCCGLIRLRNSATDAAVRAGCDT